LDSGRMQVKREPVDVPEFVRGLASSIDKTAVDKGIRVHTEVAPDVGRVALDRDKMEKVLLNLLFNSIKFTPSGGRIDFRAKRRDSRLVLEVADSGMGISEEQLPYVFDRFWQADTSTKRKFQGAGIGLSLVKELVEAHEGKVSAKSRLGRGTTMSVELPYVEAPVESEDATVPAVASHAEPERDEWLADLYRRADRIPSIHGASATLEPTEARENGNEKDGDKDSNLKPRVLIADDEPDMLRFLRSQLAGRFQVLEAVDGNQVVEKATQALPDVILCDMMMPEKDGLQVCRELQAQSATRNIPFVLLTARADEETKLSVLAAGASDFLTKPFSVTELHVRLKNLVESHQLQIELAQQNQRLASALEQLRETETQLVQSEKMASLGQMSAGIIHEINNPLNYAKTALFTLRNQAKHLKNGEQTEFEDIVRDIDDAVNRVKNIVSDLRAFAHPDPEKFEDVNLQRAIAEALRFLSHEWRDKVKVDLEVPESAVCWGNRNNLIQVFMNLLQNALDTLKRKSFAAEGPHIRITAATSGEFTEIVIRDNGEGIARANLQKIFEPFFTTRDVGEGLGLGLSICYRIVKQHRGEIVVESEPGQWSEFRVKIPRQAQPAKT
ncbi:MAG: response regulator, partial [Verrucomicrobiae bacterium]|nr:response regulator [Verrucomicrobiae bacterium]